MTIVNRIRDWYLTRFRGAGWPGKLILLVVPLLFACCVVSFLSTLISPPDDATPTAEIMERAATVEVAAVEPTEEPTDAPTATDEPPTVPPTATSEPTATETAIATATPAPTATVPPLAAYPEIATVNKPAEYVDIRNATAADVSMAGWVLFSEHGSQSCPLDGIGTLPAGQTIRIFALRRATEPGQFSCGFDTEIWNNSERDAAVLLAPGGVEVSRW